HPTLHSFPTRRSSDLSKFSTGTLAPTPRPARDVSSYDADLKAVQELIHRYYQLGVWEDPNVALLGPIIDTYCGRTRFMGKSLIKDRKSTRLNSSHSQI